MPMQFLSVMQYTGLTDKDGKEIYESDILKKSVGNDEGYFVVVWRDNGFCLEYKFTNEFQGKSYVETNYFPIYPDNYKVVGNIYEDKELAKAKANNRRKIK